MQFNTKKTIDTKKYMTYHTWHVMYFENGRTIGLKKGIEMNINEILGEYDTRYFGAGHKNTEYLIKDIYKKETSLYQANATVNISKKNWSIKGGKIMKAHLSTIDALVLSCLMVEKALTNINLDRFYVHKFVIRAGSSAIENY